MKITTDPSNPKIIPAVMPSFLEEEKPVLAETNYSGTSCQSMVMAYLQMNNINVAEPSVDNGVDLLVEVSPKTWLNAQVKKVTLRQDKRDVNGNILPRFQLNFQNTQQNLSPERIDLYYHVLITKHRTMIWSVDAEHVPKKPDSDLFVTNTNIILDREKKEHYETEFQKNLKLLYAMYSPQVYKEHSSFFA